MRCSGKICLCVLMLTLSRAAFTDEIVEYSMYDEFGSLMFNAPGRLVQNDRRTYRFNDDSNNESESSSFRYHFGVPETREETRTYSFQSGKNKQQRVWKFRPRDEKKAKKIIKIEDQPVVPVFRYPRYRPSMLEPPSMFMPYLP